MIAHFLAPFLLALSFLVSGTPLFGVGQGDCTGTAVSWRTSPTGNWDISEFGVCTTCPLTGTCQVLNNKTTVGCQ